MMAWENCSNGLRIVLKHLLHVRPFKISALDVVLKLNLFLFKIFLDPGRLSEGKPIFHLKEKTCTTISHAPQKANTEAGTGTSLSVQCKEPP